MASRINTIANQIVASFSSSLTQAIFEALTDQIPEVKKVISDTYDHLLVNIVTNRNSKTRPENYKETFMDRIEEFNFVEATGQEVKFITPDTKNFDFSGRLRVLETILEGVAGIYVEVSSDQYKAIYGTQKISMSPLDSASSPKEMIYLLKYDSFLRSKEKELKIKLVRYPFSNHPPIDLFSEVDTYVKKHLSSWINDGVSMAKKDFTNSYSRGTLA